MDGTWGRKREREESGWPHSRMGPVPHWMETGAFAEMGKPGEGVGWL